MRGKQRRLARDESKRPLVSACRFFPFLLTVGVESPADSRAAELFALSSPAKAELVLALSALATVREQPAAVTRHAAHAARVVVRLSFGPQNTAVHTSHYRRGDGSGELNL